MRMNLFLLACLNKLLLMDYILILKQEQQSIKC